MTRQQAFESYADHGWLGRLYAKLGEDGRESCRQFIRTNAALGFAEFERAVNRMFLDRPKPKNWKVIMELLTCANSRSRDFLEQEP